jgi:hypothetical protein
MAFRGGLEHESGKGEHQGAHPQEDAGVVLHLDGWVREDLYLVTYEDDCRRQRDQEVEEDGRLNEPRQEAGEGGRGVVQVPEGEPLGSSPPEIAGQGGDEAYGRVGDENEHDHRGLPALAEQDLQDCGEHGRPQRSRKERPDERDGQGRQEGHVRVVERRHQEGERDPQEGQARLGGDPEPLEEREAH